MSIGEDEAVLFDDETRTVRGRHSIASVVVADSEVLDLEQIIMTSLRDQF